MAKPDETQAVKVASCAASASSSCSVLYEPTFDTGTRKLSKRDSEMLLHRMKHPRKPNKAMREAARKYWNRI